MIARPIAALLLAALVGQAQATTPFRDPRDGAMYPVVRIGSLEWFTRNLAFVVQPSWCYDNRNEGCDTHGRLYQWTTAVSACPPGWRLPTDDDWIDLEASLGLASHVLRSEGPRGTDQGTQLLRGGLNALISGYRRPQGEFVRRNERSAFWAATEANAVDAWHRDVRPDVGTVYRTPVTKTYALSVRCVR